MSKVAVTKDKLDYLANAISAKSGESLTLTIDEMIEAVDGIETGGGEPNLQSKTYTVSAAGTETIEADSGYDGLSEVEVTVPQANPSMGFLYGFYTDLGVRKWRAKAEASFDDGETQGWMGTTKTGDYTVFNAVPSGTTITPTESAQTIGGSNYMMEGAVTVNAISSSYVGSGITRRSSTDLTASGATVTVPSGYYSAQASKAVASGTAGTPTATKGTVSNHSVSVTPSVTNTTGYITGSTKTGTAVSVSASELVSGTYTVDSSGTKDVTNYASASVPSGTAGTPTASKGTVSNHAVSITPSVTNTTGFITGSTKTGTAVSVSASELVSGSQTLSDNGDYDVTNLASVTVSVSGSGGGNLTVASKTATLSSASSSISFTGLSGNPTSFVVTSSADQTTGGTKVVAVAYDGTNLFGMDITSQAEADTGFTKAYSSGTLTITATTAQFQANEYKLVYTYGGSSSDIHTADVQVGSGATSITFSSLSGRPAYFSCVFKSTFSTSSGYQRVIDVVNDGTNTYGHAMDSEANAQTSWSYSYSGGSLTITSTGTNNGGYFHQPGYYQLTYAVDGSAPQYESISKTYRASTSAQSETITPSSGYDAIEEVSVSIPAVSQTNLTAANIKSGTTISISNGQSNLWSVTGTYTGSGGGSSSIDTKTTTSSNRPTSLSFTSMKGEPQAFVLRCTSSMTRSSNSSYYYVATMRYNGTNTNGNCWRMSNGNRTNITSGYSWSYSGTTLTLTSSGTTTTSPGCFYPGNYELVYIY